MVVSSKFVHGWVYGWIDENIDDRQRQISARAPLIFQGKMPCC